MKGKHGVAALAAAVALVLAMLAGAALAGEGMGKAMPAADAKAFWTYITQDNPYTAWAQIPGREGLHPGNSPHGAFLKVFVNDVALKAMKAGEKTLPQGAILVKENYGKDQKTLMAVTPMYKVKGFDSQANDWWWAKLGPKGEDLASGKVEGCIKCHESQTDFRFLAPQ